MAKKAARKAPAKAAHPVVPLAQPAAPQAPTAAQEKASAKATEQAGLERQKAAGQTESQQAIAEYNRGDFQTTDPVTGEPRGKTGGNWQEEDEDEL